MNQLTFLEKIDVLGKLLFSSPIIIGIFSFSLILMILLFINNKFNKKIIKFIFVGVYLIIIGYTFVRYGGYFLTSIDSFITLFMANIYFPTIPIYAFIMIISFIIMIFTLSGKNKSKIVKIINVVFFTLIQMLFAIFIVVIESNNIDLSSNSNIYSNEQALTLLELGMGLFVIWIVILLVILYLKKADKIFKTKNTVSQDDFDEYINDYNEPKKNFIKTSNSNSSVNKKIDKNVSLVPEFSFDSNMDILPINEKNSTSDILPVNEVGINGFNSSLFESNSEEVLSMDDSVISAKYDPANYNNGEFDGFNFGNQFVDNSINKNDVSSKKTNVFDNFDFVDIKEEPVRRGEDAEIVDIDF